jgi:hypothetical protein
MKDNPAMRAAEKLLPIRKDGAGYLATDSDWIGQVAAIIEAEYTTERRECVRVMKFTVNWMENNCHSVCLAHGATASCKACPVLTQLRELIGKLGE